MLGSTDTYNQPADECFVEMEECAKTRIRFREEFAVIGNLLFATCDLGGGGQSLLLTLYFYESTTAPSSPYICAETNPSGNVRRLVALGLVVIHLPLFCNR